MLMILNSTSPSLLQILLLIFPSFLLRLILSLIGLLQIASLSIPQKLNFFLSPQQRSKLTSSTLAFQGTPLSTVSSCRNLGVILDNDLSFKRHISSISSSSFYHIRQLRQVRSSLDRSSAIVLANSLVFSKLDYCNSLFN